MDPTHASVLSSNFVLLFQIIVNQKEPDHPSFYINIRSKGTFSSKKEPIGKVWYIAARPWFNSQILAKHKAEAQTVRRWSIQICRMRQLAATGKTEVKKGKQISNRCQYAMMMMMIVVVTLIVISAVMMNHH